MSINVNFKPEEEQKVLNESKNTENKVISSNDQSEVSDSQLQSNQTITNNEQPTYEATSTSNRERVYNTSTKKTAYTVNEVLSRGLPPIKFLVDNLIIQNIPNEGDKKLISLNGDPGEGKTLLTLQLMVCIAGKIDFLSKFHINNEDNRPVMLITMEDSYSRTASLINKMLLCYVEKGLIKKEDVIDIQDNIIISADRELLSIEYGEFRELKKYLNSLDKLPCLIALDNYSNLVGEMGFDSNSMDGTSKIVAPMCDIASMGITFLVITHTNKNKVKGLYRNQGNNTFSGFCKECLLLTKKEGELVLEMTKSNDLQLATYKLKRDFPLHFCIGGYNEAEKMASREEDMKLYVKKLQAVAETKIQCVKMNIKKTYTELASELNAEGFTTKTDEAWTGDYLNKEINKLKTDYAKYLE